MSEAERFPQRVLIITRHYAPEPVGSAPPMYQMASWLAAQGYRVEVVTVRPSYPGTAIFKGYDLGEHDMVWESGVKVQRFPTPPVTGASLLSRLGPETKFLLSIWAARLSGKIKPSPLVVSLCPSILTVLGALALKTRAGRHITVVHDVQSGLGQALGGRVTRMILPLLRAVEVWTLNRVDGLVVLSTEMLNLLRSIGVHVPAAVEPPMIDIRNFEPTASSSGSALTVMYSGNLGRKQGLGQVLDLADELLKRRLDIKIIIKGEGAMKASLAKELQDRSLSNVSLQPLAPASEMWASLSSADLHLVPQVSAGSDSAVPSKAFSIMGAARPFIATAVSQSSLGVLAAQSGAFTCVTPDTPGEFADAVESLGRDPGKREVMGALGRAYALAHADTHSVMSRLEPFITGDLRRD